jgi:NADH:ubiquinone oxidoreductase subunit 5 (subunit L)/multisubunit Na+/H+ antiporter MnhA subunit
MLSILLPLIGFIFSFFGRYLGRFVLSTFIIFTVILAFIQGCILATTVFINHTTLLYSFSWIKLNNLDLKFTFYLIHYL